MNININTTSRYPLTLLRDNFLNSFTSTQQKVITVVAIAFGLLAVCYAGYRLIVRPWLEMKKHLKPDWINVHPNTPLKSLGLNTFDALLKYVQENGKNLHCLNLYHQEQLDDSQFAQLVNCCPHLEQIAANAFNLTDAALANLKGKPLTKVDFLNCTNMTDAALVYLKGLHLTSVSFRNCPYITDEALVHLQGMPLASVTFGTCNKLTDAALGYIKGMPLTTVNFSACKRLTDAALGHLKGMQLTDVYFNRCEELTDGALTHLHGMPLKNVGFSECNKLTDAALLNLKGMPLEWADFDGCDKLTDAARSQLPPRK